MSDISVPTQRTDQVSGTSVRPISFNPYALALTRYWLTPTSHKTEEIALAFADSSEFKAFLRAVQAFGRRQGYLTTKAKKKATS